MSKFIVRGMLGYIHGGCIYIYHVIAACLNNLHMMLYNYFSCVASCERTYVLVAPESAKVFITSGVKLLTQITIKIKVRIMVYYFSYLT